MAPRDIADNQINRKSETRERYSGEYPPSLLICSSAASTSEGLDLENSATILEKGCAADDLILIIRKR